jgi:hypothetical protein
MSLDSEPSTEETELAIAENGTNFGRAGDKAAVSNKGSSEQKGNTTEQVEHLPGQVVDRRFIFLNGNAHYESL